MICMFSVFDLDGFDLKLEMNMLCFREAAGATIWGKGPAT